MLVVASSLLPATEVGADAAGDAERAAQQIVAAQDRANAAADAWAHAQSRLDGLDHDLAALAAKLAAGEQQVSALRNSARRMALLRYTSGDGGQLALFIASDDLATKVQMRVFAQVATQGTTGATTTTAPRRTSTHNVSGWSARGETGGPAGWSGQGTLR
jgi:hypothetical protein